jgi:hypothetical protein
MSVVRTVFLTLGLVSAALLGCGEEIDEVTNTITCGDVCGRYADCFDEDYDVEACTERCENDTTPDEEKEAELEECHACLDGESCTDAVFQCTTECVQFVP